MHHRTHARRVTENPAEFDALDHLPRGAERSRLRARVISRHLPMADRIARRYYNRGESDDDLRQVARLGLVKAVDGYDPAQGSFAPYAMPTIVGEIKRHFRDHTWDTHVPRRQQELRNRVRSALQDMERGPHGAEPEPAAIADRTGLTVDEVRRGLEARDAYSAMSLDAPVDPSGELPLADTLGEPEPGFDRVVQRETLKPLLAELSERERRILQLRYFDDLTQREIGRIVGISQMHVSRLLTATCRRLRARAAL